MKEGGSKKYIAYFYGVGRFHKGEEGNTHPLRPILIGILAYWHIGHLERGAGGVSWHGHGVCIEGLTSWESPWRILCGVPDYHFPLAGIGTRQP